MPKSREQQALSYLQKMPNCANLIIVNIKKRGISKKSNSIKMKGVFFLLILFLFAFTIVSQKFLAQTQDSSTQASASSCGKLIVRVSTDGKNWSKKINLNKNTGKYYLQALTQEGRPCSTSFDARYRYCSTENSQSCGSTRVTSPWAAYRSDVDGIARVDFSNISSGVHLAEMRPSGETNAEWSNGIVVQITHTSSDSSEKVNITDYIVSKPGYSYLFTTSNYAANQFNMPTRLQMEEKTEVCGITTIPWRFSKNTPAAYWNPKVPVGGYAGNENLRWFVVDPSFSYGTQPVFNNYIWAVGDKRYRLSNNPLADLGSPTSGLLYQSVTGRVPAYNLGPKQLPHNLTYLDQATKESSYQSTNTLEPCASTTASSSKDSSWKVRTEKDTLVINNPGFSYSGEALRIDYFEGNGKLEDEPMLRESWYFIKNIGLAKISIKHFNGYYNMGALAKSCRADSDCFADTMRQPHVELTLNSWQHNPKLEVSVSVNGSQYSKNITAQKTSGYYLKIDNSDYTGYLEAQIGNGTYKWLWADKGVVRVTPAILSGISSGTYVAKFRIWVPDEIFPNEKRVSNTNIDWSNAITVRLN